MRARRRNQAGPERSGYLFPAELCQPETHIVEADLAAVAKELRAHFGRHRAELQSFANLTGYTPTLLKLLILCRPMQRGFQVPRRALAKWFGCAMSTVAEAFRAGVELGLLERFSNVRNVADITAKREKPLTTALARASKGAGGGRQGRTRVNVHGVVYLTAAGCRVVDGLGWISDFLRGQEGRKRIRTGLVANLWRTLQKPLAVAHVRCTAPARNRTPEASTKPSSSSHSGGSPSAPRGEEPPPTASEEVRAHARRSATGPQVTDGPFTRERTAEAQGSEGEGATTPEAHPLPQELAEARYCAENGIHSADAWRPDAWRRALPLERLWLVRQFEPIRKLLAGMTVRGELAAGPSDHVPDDRLYEKGKPHPSRWWSGYGSNAHLDQLERERRLRKRQRV